MIKYIKCLSVLLSFSLLASNKAQAQNLKTYSGIVTNLKGEALDQVVIQVKGAAERTISDGTGKFNIKGAHGDTLLFNKTGFRETKLAVGEGASLVVALNSTDRINRFDEYINIPFDRRTGRTLNYAYSTISAEQLPIMPLTNMQNILGGRLSGLLVMQTGNKPGSDNVSFQVRGKSSYAQGSAPVILVDGVERDFTGMDQNEIESVTILKDAAALNWYGLYAGNGAILVTTKHGRANQNYIDFTAQAGFQQTSHVMQPLTSYDFATLYNQGLNNAGKDPAYSQIALDAYRNHTDLYLYPDNNYVGRFLGNIAPVQRYALSLGGGGEKVRYFTTISYINQNGLFKESKTDNYNSNFNFKRLNFRVNLDYDVTKTLSFTLLTRLRSSLTNEAGDGTESVLNTLFTLPPNAFPIQNADGSYGGTSVYQTNPLGQLQAAGVDKATYNNLTASISAKQKLDIITRGLSANVFFSYDVFGNYSHGFSQNYAVVNQSVTPAQTFRTPAILAYSSSAFGTNTKNTEVWAGLDYDRTFGGEHHIIASARAQQYISSAVDRIDYRGQMLVARADYGFKNRYFLGFTGSYSGSEDYAPGRRFGFFPAVSAGWVISDEDFLKSVDFLTYLKARASFGRTGNIGPTYDSNGNLVRLPYRTLFTRGAGPILGSSFSGTTTAYAVSPAGNPLTTWEKIDRLNVGADLGFLKNDFTLSVDYFNENRTDILSNAILPSILGVSVSSFNSGQVKSHGVDLSAAYQKAFNNKLSLGVNGNFTYATNKLITQLLPNGTLSYQSPVGHNIGNVSGSGTKRFYVSDGVFQDDVQINASPKQLLSGLVVPGDIRYKDINSDDLIDSRDAMATNYTDIPRIYYGFGFNLIWGFFDINAQFQGIYGRTIDIRQEVYAGPNGLNKLSLESWTPATASTARFPRIALSDNGNNNANSDFWLRSGDFLKLRTVEAGFSLPPSVTGKLQLRKVRLFVGGFNLWTISKLKGFDIDPETPTAGMASNYPYVKTYTLGLNVRF